MTNCSTLLSRKYYSYTHKCSLVGQTLVNETSTHGLSFTLKSWAESLVLMSINYAWPLLEVTSFTVDNSENFPTSFQYSCRYKICGDILKLAGKKIRIMVQLQVHIPYLYFQCIAHDLQYFEGYFGASFIQFCYNRFEGGNQPIWIFLHESMNRYIFYRVLAGRARHRWA